MVCRDGHRGCTDHIAGDGNVALGSIIPVRITICCGNADAAAAVHHIVCKIAALGQGYIAFRGFHGKSACAGAFGFQDAVDVHIALGRGGNIQGGGCADFSRSYAGADGNIAIIGGDQDSVLFRGDAAQNGHIPCGEVTAGIVGAAGSLNGSFTVRHQSRLRSCYLYIAAGGIQFCRIGCLYRASTTRYSNIAFGGGLHCDGASTGHSIGNVRIPQGNIALGRLYQHIAIAVLGRGLQGAVDGNIGCIRCVVGLHLGARSGYDIARYVNSTVGGGNGCRGSTADNVARISISTQGNDPGGIGDADGPACGVDCTVYGDGTGGRAKRSIACNTIRSFGAGALYGPMDRNVPGRSRGQAGVFHSGNIGLIARTCNTHGNGAVGGGNGHVLGTFYIAADGDVACFISGYIFAIIAARYGNVAAAVDAVGIVSGFNEVNLAVLGLDQNIADLGNAVCPILVRSGDRTVDGNITAGVGFYGSAGLGRGFAVEGDGANVAFDVCSGAAGDGNSTVITDGDGARSIIASAVGQDLYCLGGSNIAVQGDIALAGLVCTNSGIALDGYIALGALQHIRIAISNCQGNIALGLYQHTAGSVCVGEQGTIQGDGTAGRGDRNAFFGSREGASQVNSTCIGADINASPLRAVVIGNSFRSLKYSSSQQRFFYRFIYVNRALAGGTQLQGAAYKGTALQRDGVVFARSDGCSACCCVQSYGAMIFHSHAAIQGDVAFLGSDADAGSACSCAGGLQAAGDADVAGIGGNLGGASCLDVAGDGDIASCSFSIIVRAVGGLQGDAAGAGDYIRSIITCLGQADGAAGGGFYVAGSTAGTAGIQGTGNTDITTGGLNGGAGGRGRGAVQGDITRSRADIGRVARGRNVVGSNGITNLASQGDGAVAGGGYLNSPCALNVSLDADGAALGSDIDSPSADNGIIPRIIRIGRQGNIVAGGGDVNRPSFVASGIGGAEFARYRDGTIRRGLHGGASCGIHIAGNGQIAHSRSDLGRFSRLHIPGDGNVAQSFESAVSGIVGTRIGSGNKCRARGVNNRRGLSSFVLFPFQGNAALGRRNFYVAEVRTRTGGGQCAGDVDIPFAQHFYGSAGLGGAGAVQGNIACGGFDGYRGAGRSNIIYGNIPVGGADGNSIHCLHLTIQGDITFAICCVSIIAIRNGGAAHTVDDVVTALFRVQGDIAAGGFDENIFIFTFRRGGNHTVDVNIAASLNGGIGIGPGSTVDGDFPAVAAGNVRGGAFYGVLLAAGAHGDSAGGGIDLQGALYVSVALDVDVTCARCVDRSCAAAGRNNLIFFNGGSGSCLGQVDSTAIGLNQDIIAGI